MGRAATQSCAQETTIVDSGLSPAMGTIETAEPGYDVLGFGAAFSVPCVKKPDLLSGFSFVRKRPLQAGADCLRRSANSSAIC